MQKMKKIGEDNRGFTLVELIVTIVILALVTAPFLSSFVTASNTNVKSKKIQEANELSQYIIEQCKAMGLDKIEDIYASTYKEEDCIIDTSDSDYQKTSKKYSWTISDGNGLPAGYSSKYSADVTVTPVKTVVNGDEAIPVIDNINKSECAVFAKRIYKNDSNYTDADIYKELTVEVTYDDGSYIVNYKLAYYKLGATTALKTDSEEFRYSYDVDAEEGAKIPSVYILYTPISANMDKIHIINNVTENKSNGTKLNVYIIEQSVEKLSGQQTKVEKNNVLFNEGEDISLLNLLESGNTSKLDNTVVYTNIGDNKSGTDDYINDTVMTTKIDTLYNINVDIKYAGKTVTTYESTKVDMK